jgi:hypothetical protein
LTWNIWPGIADLAGAPACLPNTGTSFTLANGAEQRRGPPARRDSPPGPPRQPQWRLRLSRGVRVVSFPWIFDRTRHWRSCDCPAPGGAWRWSACRPGLCGLAILDHRMNKKI